MTGARKPSRPQALPRAAVHILLAIGPDERHGYAIMTEIARMTDGAVRMGPGAIYTTIKRLLADGLIAESEERPCPELDDQRRRYYRLTPQGRAAAAAEVRSLDALVAAARRWALEVP